jgi:hypothetical protein
MDTCNSGLEERPGLMARNSSLEKQPRKIDIKSELQGGKNHKHHSVSQQEVFSKNGDQKGLLLVSVLSLAIRQAEG